MVGKYWALLTICTMLSILSKSCSSIAVLLKAPSLASSFKQLNFKLHTSQTRGSLKLHVLRLDFVRNSRKIVPDEADEVRKPTSSLDGDGIGEYGSMMGEVNEGGEEGEVEV